MVFVGLVEGNEKSQRHLWARIILSMEGTPEQDWHSMFPERQVFVRPIVSNMRRLRRLDLSSSMQRPLESIHHDYAGP